MTELHADMTLQDILKANPKAKEILFEHGILIDIDRVKAHESLGEVFSAHNISKRKADEVVKDLNMLP
jgi:hypothetical protein